MKLAYVAQIDMRREDGVTKKIRGQVLEWQRHGNDVKLFAMARSHDVWSGWGDLPLDVRAHSGGYSRFATSRALAQQVFDWGPDIVYFRMGACYPAFRQLASRFPTVIERNSNDLAESGLTYGRFKLLYHRVTRRALLRQVRGIVAVSNELVDESIDRSKPVLVQGNGIALENYPTLPPVQNTYPRLVFIGTGAAAWHGVDKIVRLAKHFTDWRFDLVGELAALVGDERPPNVVVHGYLTSDRYDRVLAQADVAIGTLALHRKHMQEASPLKTREYLARGLPTIIAYRDTDFPAPVPYLLQLPNTADNVEVSLHAIEQFVRQWKSHRVPQHLVSHLDVRVKESERIKFLSNIIASPRQSDGW